MYGGDRTLAVPNDCLLGPSKEVSEVLARLLKGKNKSFLTTMRKHEYPCCYSCISGYQWTCQSQVLLTQQGEWSCIKLIKLNLLIPLVLNELGQVPGAAQPCF